MSLGMSRFSFKEKFCRLLFPLVTLGLVSCTIEDLPELSMDSVAIYTAPDANQNSAIAVDLVLVYNQELLKTLGQMSALKYFAASRQLLLDNPSLLDIWHWELVPGQVVENFSPAQDKGDAYGAYVFANYLTAGDHRLKVAPDGIVKILLLRDDLKNLATFNTHDVNIGTTMSNVINKQEMEEVGFGEMKLGPTSPMPSCQRRAPPPCSSQRPEICPCPSPRRPVQIITQPLNPVAH